MGFELDASISFTPGPPAGPIGESDRSVPDSEADLSKPDTVLIVEDEALVAMNMEMALGEAGFHVLGVVDTEYAAVQAAKRLKPAIVLMDITLRDGSGIAAARAIHGLGNSRIIFVSGNSDPRTLQATGELQGSGFIRKPFVTERLAALVRQALRDAGR